MSETIADITLDETTIQYRNPEIKHEREMAIRDLKQENRFHLLSEAVEGPYNLNISAVDQRLFINVQQAEDNSRNETIILSMRGFRKLIKDYFMMWEAYSAGLATHTPEKMQALDMGRRAIHNEGAELLQKGLQHEAELDFDTARRLFTLICILHIK